MTTSYEQISQMLMMIQGEADREKLAAMHLSLQSRIEYWPASRRRHHAWVGGYADHVKEVVMLGIGLYKMIVPVTPTAIDFTQDDVIIVCYVHDLDKLYRYKDMPAGDYRRQEKYGGQIWEVADDIFYPDESAKVTQLCAKHGLILTDQQIEAVSHHHGGFSTNLSSVYSYSSDGGGMSKLSTLVHSADLMSGYMFGYVKGKGKK
jgi:23S rRNA maturation-related 3'-5' exoribonuclease YhaM